MDAYIDTSVIAKRYLKEEGSDYVDNLFKELSHIECSTLTRLELTALVERSKKENKINSSEYRHIFQSIKSDIATLIFLVSIDAKIIDNADELIKRHFLRAPDAIHLATALFAQKRIKKDLKFLSADNRLIEAAKLEGLVCLNPLGNL